MTDNVTKLVTKLERQKQREQDSRTEGVHRYQKKIASKDVLDTSAGKVLVFGQRGENKNVIELLSDVLNSVVDRVESGKAGSGRPTLIAKYLQQLDTNVVSYLTTRITLQAALSNAKLTATAMRLANAMEDTYRFDELMLSEPNLGHSMERKANRHTSASHRTTIMRKAANVASVKGLEWSDGEKVKLGGALIDRFIENWKAVDRETGEIRPQITLGIAPNGKSNQTASVLNADAGLSAWLEQAHMTKAVTEPKFQPMIVKPNDWTSVNTGGYLTEACKQPFVRKLSPELRDEMMSLDLSKVFKSVNLVQSTPWRVNQGVLDVMSEVWASGSTLGDVPSADDQEIPARPADISKDLRTEDMTEAQKARLQAWKHEAHQKHTENGQLSGKRCGFITQLSMAKDLREEEEFYFPHNVDFRGRLYPIVPALNPQADDFGKSLLQFAKGKPLGNNGAFWLAVQIANLFGFDKATFEERVAWVQDNEQAILESALNPLDGQRFWTTADSPWQALAACFEWLGFNLQGEAYVSHLPIAMDGSCSGLQHFSAMLKDSVGAQAVNLCKADKPADIYTQVQHRAEELLMKDTSGLSLAWRGKLTRKICKRPCMTFAYSVTATGMRGQILDQLNKETGSKNYLSGFDNFTASSFIAPIIEQAIRDTVKRAAEAMDYLKESVRGLLKEGRAITWSTPLGFIVQQRYVTNNAKRFNVWFQGRRLRMNLRVDTNRPDTRKQAAAVAPNFVHSLDACHLQMVTNRLADEGVTDSFSMIHDSFGVHACDVDELHYAIRDEFVKLYSTSQLTKFRNWSISTLPPEARGDFPEVPEEGDFNLEQVHEADFFFA